MCTQNFNAICYTSLLVRPGPRQTWDSCPRFLQELAPRGLHRPLGLIEEGAKLDTPALMHSTEPSPPRRRPDRQPLSGWGSSRLV